MKRSYKAIDLPDRVRHVVEIVDDSGQSAAGRGQQFLHQIVNENPTLLHCGPLAFETMRIERVDNAWRILAEATEQKSNAVLQ